MGGVREEGRDGRGEGRGEAGRKVRGGVREVGRDGRGERRGEGWEGRGKREGWEGKGRDGRGRGEQT